LLNNHGWVGWNNMVEALGGTQPVVLGAHRNQVTRETSQ
jgi:hypothetical protein